MGVRTGNPLWVNGIDADTPTNVGDPPISAEAMEAIEAAIDASVTAAEAAAAAPVQSVAGRTGAVTLAVADIEATGIPSASTYLRGDGSWATPDGAGALDALTDVSTTGATSGQALVYDGTSWAPATITGGTGLDTEGVQDVVGAMVQQAGGTYDDGAGTITLPSGGASSTITADDTPAAPAEGESASYFVTSAVSWPAGLVWSTDPDGGVAPTITGTALVSLFTVGGVTRAIMGATFPAPPDTTAPAWSATLTTGTPAATSVVVAASALATDAVGDTGYERSLDGGSTWAAITPSGLNFTLTGLTAATAYPAPRFRAKDAAGNVSAVLTAQAFTTGSPPTDTTKPIPGTLASSNVTSSDATLTVTGASDAGAGLHATPYRFSHNNGTTWGAWQANNVTTLAALTTVAASTAYTCRHEVRDAAATPNTELGTAITVTTTPGLVTAASDNFDTGTGELNGRVTTGGATWVATPGQWEIIAPGDARNAVNTDGIVAYFNVGDQEAFDIDASITYEATQLNPAIVFRRKDSANFYYFALQPNNASAVTLYRLVDGTHNVLGTDPGLLSGMTAPLAVHLAIRGTAITGTINGVTIAWTTAPTLGALVSGEVGVGLRNGVAGGTTGKTLIHSFAYDGTVV